MPTVPPTQPTIRALAALRRGQRARIAAVDSAGGLPQRVAMLGLRRGVELHVVLGPDARGAVVRVGAARIALGRDIVERIAVTALSDAEPR